MQNDEKCTQDSQDRDAYRKKGTYYIYIYIYIYVYIYIYIYIKVRLSISIMYIYTYIYIYIYVHIRSSSGRLRLFTYAFVHTYVRTYVRNIFEPSLGSCWAPEKIRKREGLNLKSESYLILARIPKRHASNLRTSRVSTRSYRILISEIGRKSILAPLISPFLSLSNSKFILFVYSGFWGGIVYIYAWNIFPN